MNTQVHIEETERQALTRLLAKAKAEGVQIRRDHKDGRYWASSTSTPGHWHLVTGYSCDCRGFMAHQRCKHHAALLSALGWLTIDPEPQTPMALTVLHTDGYYTLAREPEWIEPITWITVDGEDTVKVEGESYGLTVHWLQDGKPVDDLTAATPAGLDHYTAVQYWTNSIDATVQPQVLMQEANLHPADAFHDSHPIAA